MKIRYYALAAALLAAPVPMLAQTQQQPPRAEREHRMQGREGRMHREGHRGVRGQGRRMRNPVQMLIERRQQLSLSNDQVQRLQAIQQRLETQNRSLTEQLRQLRGPDGVRPEARGGELTQEQREQLRARREQIRERARPIAEQLRNNHRQAMNEVQSILTDAQKQQIRQFRQEHRGEGRQGREGRRGREGRERREGRAPQGENRGS